MPQPGLHAVVALASKRWFPKKPMLATGLVFGSLVPDLDGYAQAVAVLLKVNPAEAEATYHRTLTHSLFTALAIGLLFQVVGAIRSSDRTRWFGIGLMVGMAVFHGLLDILAWFDGVGILWPVKSVNLWQSVHLSELVTNLLRAGNFLAFAAYFFYFLKLAKEESPYLRRLRTYTILQLGIGIVMTVLAVTIPAKTYGFLDGGILLLWAYPNALWVTWKMKDTIEGSHHA